MILDHDRVRDITRNNSMLIASISQLFLAELPDMIKCIEDAYQQTDREGLTSAIHRLKSALGNFVTSSYYQEFSGLEIAASSNSITLHDNWLMKWNVAKPKLDTLVLELKEMVGS